MKTATLALLLGLSCFAPLASTAEFPERIDIRYSISSGSLEGEVNNTLRIRHENGIRSYAISSEARAKGLLVLTQPDPILLDSTGRITEAGILRPGRFSDRHGRNIPKVAIFDWDRTLLTLQHKRGEEKKTLPTDIQDKLSLPYSFIFSPPPGKMLELHVTDGRRLESMRYAVGRETIDTPMGRLETFTLTRLTAAEGERDRKIWLAIDHHMLPVRIVTEEKMGIVTDQMVTRISYGEPAADLRQGRLQAAP